MLSIGQISANGEVHQILQSMTKLKITASALLLFILTACVYVPVSNHDAESATCKTVTHSMSLDKLETFDMESRTPNVVGNMGNCQGSSCAAFLAGIIAVAAAVSAGSVIISGSIVITDNTIHWLEYQGTCSDGYLNYAKKMFLNSMNVQKAER